MVGEIFTDESVAFTVTVTSFEVMADPQVGVEVHTTNQVPTPKAAPVGVKVFPFAPLIFVMVPPDTDRTPH